MFGTNTGGTKVWTAAYLPFGGVRTTTGTPITARFPGQWFQSESGLHQNWMRDYDPTTRLYLQADPLVLVDGASIYGYVKQYPGRWFDSKGEQSKGDVAYLAYLMTGNGPVNCSKIASFLEPTPQMCTVGENGGIIVETPEGPIETFSSTEQPETPPKPEPPEDPWWAKLIGLIGDILTGVNGG